MRTGSYRCNQDWTCISCLLEESNPGRTSGNTSCISVGHVEWPTGRKLAAVNRNPWHSKSDSCSSYNSKGKEIRNYGFLYYQLNWSWYRKSIKDKNRTHPNMKLSPVLPVLVASTTLPFTAWTVNELWTRTGAPAYSRLYAGRSRLCPIRVGQNRTTSSSKDCGLNGHSSGHSQSLGKILTGHAYMYNVQSHEPERTRDKDSNLFLLVRNQQKLESLTGTTGTRRDKKRLEGSCHCPSPLKDKKYNVGS